MRRECRELLERPGNRGIGILSLGRAGVVGRQVPLVPVVPPVWLEAYG